MRKGAVLAAGSGLGRMAGGFTLIEMVVVVLIVGILASAAMPMAELQVRRGQEQALRGGQQPEVFVHKSAFIQGGGAAPHATLNAAQDCGRVTATRRIPLPRLRKYSPCGLMTTARCAAGSEK